MMIFLHSFMRKTMYGVCIFPQYPKHFIYLRLFQYSKYKILYWADMVHIVNTTSLDMIVDLQELKNIAEHCVVKCTLPLYWLVLKYSFCLFLLPYVLYLQNIIFGANVLFHNCNIYQTSKEEIEKRQPYFRTEIIFKYPIRVCIWFREQR